MTLIDLVFTITAIALVSLTTKYRKNALIIAVEFAASLLVAIIIIDFKGYEWAGGCWLFGARALILYAAMRATLRINGHKMAYVVMLLGMILNIGAYFEYALKSYGYFDQYYAPAAQAVMVLQLVYILGIGYVGTYVGRLRVSGVRWWRAYRLSHERREITGRSE